MSLRTREIYLVSESEKEKEMESASSLGKSGTGGRGAAENSESECRPKRRKEDKGKSRAPAGSDSSMGEGSDGRESELMALVESQGQKLDALMDLWATQPWKEKELVQKASEEGMGTS